MLRLLREAFENARLAGQALFANRLRTALAVVGIGIGVATLIAIFGIIQGLNKSFASQLDAMGSSSLTVSRRPWVMGPTNWWKFRRRPPVTVRDYLEVKRQSVLAGGVAPTIDDSFDMKFADRSVSSVHTVVASFRTATTSCGSGWWCSARTWSGPCSARTTRGSGAG